MSNELIPKKVSIFEFQNGVPIVFRSTQESVYAEIYIPHQWLIERKIPIDTRERKILDSASILINELNAIDKASVYCRASFSQYSILILADEDSVRDFLIHVLNTWNKEPSEISDLWRIAYIHLPSTVSDWKAGINVIARSARTYIERNRRFRLFSFELGSYSMKLIDIEKKID